MRDDATDRKVQTRTFFNTVAPHYDVGGAFDYFGERLVALVGVEHGQRVLDVASGRGAVLFPAAERVGETGVVIGIDLAEGMVEATNEEAMRRGVALRVRVMDAEQLEFPDAAFDRVLCGFGLMFFPHLDQALGEIRRVLAPGGRLGVSVWQTGLTADLRAILNDLRTATAVSPDSAGGPGGGLPSTTIGSPITDPDALMRPLVRAGFADVRVTADSASFRFADVEQYWEDARGMALRHTLDALDAEQTERVRSCLIERLRPLQGPDGIQVTGTALLATARR
jgi:O-methyltransferase/aklanonic acid methyltransferase